MRRRFALILATLLVAGVTAAPAATESFVIDPAHSSVTFRIRHLVGKTPGSFTDFGGTVTFDPADPTTGRVEATIQATSIDTHNDKRDDHLRSPDFFDAATHPTITFKSTKVTRAGEAYKLSGDLTMHGVTKPVTLDLQVLGVGPGFAGKVAGFEARGVLQRKDFGISWNRALDAGSLVLGDEVEIVITVEAGVQTQAAAK